MKKKAGLLIGLTVIVASLGFAGKTLKTSLINYVPFTEAMAATDSTVQIMGAPAPGSMHYADGRLYFSMRDDRGTLMPVVFQGPKPDDLDTAMSKATKITAQGTYNRSQQVFVAENLLVKCPSKYQGAKGNQERSYGAS
jgi:cytochrome c-type biogenesis protein CcmE